MVVGEFPLELYKTGETEDEQHSAKLFVPSQMSRC